VAEEYKPFRNFLFLGRGVHYPIAREGALKLKESSYLHAEDTSLTRSIRPMLQFAARISLRVAGTNSPSTSMHPRVQSG